MTFLFLVPNLLFFTHDFNENFECQVGGGGQKFKFFAGCRGIKFEFRWGVSSFSGGWGA